MKDTNNFKQIAPSFGVISGVSTSVGYLPHIMALLFIALTGKAPFPLFGLILFTVGAKLLGECLFWLQLFPARMDGYFGLKNWRSFMNTSLYTNPQIYTAGINMVADSLADVFLIAMALQTGFSPFWIFFGYVLAQVIVSPLHGLISEAISHKKLLIGSSMITIFICISIGFGNEILEIERVKNWLPLGAQSDSALKLGALYAKVLLVGTTVIARASIAKFIRWQAIESAK